MGARAAADIQRRLLLKTLDSIAPAQLAPTELWVSPSTHHSVFQQARRRYTIRLQRQPSGDLGTRMAYALHRALQRSAHALIIGTDCPALTPGHIRQTFDALAGGCRVVLAPAEDGGYVLIGTRSNIPALFRDIPWSSERVMSATRNRLKRLNIDYLELATLWDVDRPADLRRARSLGLL